MSAQRRLYADRVPYQRLSLPLLHAGKVRELYELPEGRILLVATDNVSAYDRVLPTPIPDKGEVLNRLTVWWLEQLGALVPHHAITDEVPPEVAGRALVVERLEMLPYECVARGYLAGSAWQEYRESGTVAGEPMPAGLGFGARLERPVFTPARKAPQGEHDENITFEQLVAEVGPETAGRLRTLTLRLYIRAERIARERGLLLVDTKFEFGRRADGTITLADEVLTPDSSRFWDLAAYEPGTPMESFDKQYLRDWVSGASGWDVDSGEPAPELPDDVVAGTRERYVETYRRLTGEDFVPVAAAAGAESSAADEAEAVDGDEPTVDPDAPEPVEAGDVEPSGEAAGAPGAADEIGAAAGEGSADATDDERHAEDGGSVADLAGYAAAAGAGVAAVSVAASGGAAEPGAEADVSEAGPAEGDEGDAASDGPGEAPSGADAPADDAQTEAEQLEGEDGAAEDAEGGADDDGVAAAVAGPDDAAGADAEDGSYGAAGGDEGTGQAEDAPQAGDEPDAGLVGEPTAMVVVEVMPKPEHLDPRGRALSAALRRLGHEGLSVRQGTRFEIEVYGELTDDRLQGIVEVADVLLADPARDDVDVTVWTDIDDEAEDGCCGTGDCCAADDVDEDGSEADDSDRADESPAAAAEPDDGDAQP